MKKLILVCVWLSLSAAYAAAQSREAEGLRGLKGVRLVIMFNRGELMEQAQRAEVLKLLESEAKAKFRKAGIPLLQYAQELEAAGSPQLVIVITLNPPNSYASPIDIRAKFSQKVRLSRELSIEMDVTTWETFGVGGPEVKVETIRDLTSTEVNQFVADYLSVNPKPTEGAGRD